MGKLKTHKGVKRRFKITGTGKLVHMKTGRRHLLTNKAARRMRKLRKAGEVAPAQQEMLRRLMPYR